jgi:SAM-dependent methyltransferase
MEVLVGGEMTNNQNLEFYCPTHSMSLIKEGNTYKCKNSNCTIECKHEGRIYDFIREPVSNEWDISFERSKAGFVKRHFDKYLSIIFNPLFNEFLIGEISKRFNKQSRLIEIGCGEASTSISLINKNGFNVVLLDNNDNAINGAIEELEINKIKTHCTIVKANFYDTPLCFEDNYFDVSYNNGTIEHFEDPVKAVNSMKSISKTVICSVPAPSIYWKIGTLIRKTIEKDASHWIDNTQYYSLEELGSFFERAGLRNIRLHQTKFLGLPAINSAVGDV